MLTLCVLAALCWLGLLGLPWQPWRMRERFEAQASDTDHDLSDVTVLIPARDEAGVLDTTLAALARQGRGLHVRVIDDHSSDDTAAIARAVPLEHLEVMAAAPLPEGWTGKLWALEQGRQGVSTEYVVLLDADIALAPGTIAGLKRRAISDNRQLVSLMAALRMQSRWERLLMPAFIHFFKLLYPFALSNAGSRHVAASAGGCVLLKRPLLEEMGGFGCLADAVIDDCTLAARVRAAGGRTWVGVTHAATSLRGYDDFATIHDMVARSAYTQLRYSRLLLLACTVIMLVMFWIPVLGLFTAQGATLAVALVASAAMIISYLPTLSFYGLSPLWALTMPLIGTLYLGMTWSSALRYWQGVRSSWRGRAYLRQRS